MSHSIHPNTVLGIVKLKVSHLKRSLQFYTDVVGLRILNQQATTAEMTVDGITPILSLEEISSATITPRRSTAGLYHFAILVPTREALGLSLRNLIKSGIHIGQGDHLVSEALYISDPDNNGIEIYCDRPRSTWKRDVNNNIIMASDPVDTESLLREAGDKIWSGLTTDTIIGHIHLHVSDLAKSRAFYCDILGFDMVVDGGSFMGALFISAGGYHHHIGLNIWAGVGAPPPQEHGTGLKYYTIILPSESELDIVLERIKNAQIPLIQQDEIWIVVDPSGNEVRLTAA
ncbi:VOC family protein [Cohnella sp.]|uniref:VOC family protein n=1 Tax=Cohnella sp. TaxID=1883426 RepID=UPI0035678E99